MSTYFPMPPWDFFDVMTQIGLQTAEGTVNDYQHYNFNISNTPTNSTQYTSWITWLDARTMPTWAQIQVGGSAYQRYQDYFYTVYTSRSEADVACNALHTEILAVPAQVQSDWLSVTGLGAILHKPTIPAAQVQTDWNASSGIGVLLNKPSLAAVATSGSYTDLSNLPPAPSVGAATHSIVSSTSATGFQISSTRLSFANYSIQIAATLSLTTGQSSTVYLETANTNSTTPGDWTTIASVSNGNTGSLSIGLNLTQTIGAQLSGLIPAGKYVRIRSNGTATTTYISGQEMLF